MMLGARATLSRHLYMEDVARLLREDRDDNSPVSRREVDRARSRLRRLEHDTGRLILSGGGYRDGRTRQGGKRRKGGGKLWTTFDRLRHAGLVDDHLVLFESVQQRMADIEEAIELGAEQWRLLAKVVGQMQRKMGEHQEKLDVLLVRGARPARTSTRRPPDPL